MKRVISLAIASISVVSMTWLASNASEKNSNDHDESNEQHAHEDEHDHGDDGHDHGEEESEESSSVGPNKGILEANEETGFKLSPEAFKNFDPKMAKLLSRGPWTLPRTALVHSGEEVNLFRFRDGFFKRIDFKTIRQAGSDITVESNDLREGDEVVLVGMGFLRVAELAAFGGVAHGHSH